MGSAGFPERCAARCSTRRSRLLPMSCGCSGRCDRRRRWCGSSTRPHRTGMPGIAGWILTGVPGQPVYAAGRRDRRLRGAAGRTARRASGPPRRAADQLRAGPGGRAGRPVVTARDRDWLPGRGTPGCPRRGLPALGRDVGPGLGCRVCRPVGPAGVDPGPAQAAAGWRAARSQWVFRPVHIRRSQSRRRTGGPLRAMEARFIREDVAIAAQTGAAAARQLRSRSPSAGIGMPMRPQSRSTSSSKFSTFTDKVDSLLSRDVVQ